MVFMTIWALLMTILYIGVCKTALKSKKRREEKWYENIDKITASAKGDINTTKGVLFILLILTSLFTFLFFAISGSIMEGFIERSAGALLAVNAVYSVFRSFKTLDDLKFRNDTFGLFMLPIQVIYIVYFLVYTLTT